MKESSKPLKLTGAKKGLSLPVIKGEILPPRVRSMDEINSWIEQDYSLFFDRKRYEKEKRELSVDKIFVL